MKQLYEFIVISPQFNDYTRNQDGTGNYPSYQAVEDVIDYVEAKYRIDKRRIYLTGLSNGANMITEYAASSVDTCKACCRNYACGTMLANESSKQCEQKY